MPANDNTPRKETSGSKQPSALAKCPICGKPRDAEYRPFCSRRCADVDLNRWLSGSYAIPAAEEEPGEADMRTGMNSGRDEDGEN
ncbi:MAG: DNA gyrase inhibitor YacG [Rhodobiaceae bacterium]|nr:DNA gyrase inhibitor YacG [Rhodobiaceae bacterium]MCC0062010.1 DNA gyrase inhibitor YacG [Rhodobiaceae bacterium]